MSSSEKSLSRLIAVVILNHHQVQQTAPRYALRTRGYIQNIKRELASSFYCFYLFESLLPRLRYLAIFCRWRLGCYSDWGYCDLVIKIKKPAREPHILARNIREIGYRP